MDEAKGDPYEQRRMCRFDEAKRGRDDDDDGAKGMDPRGVGNSADGDDDEGPALPGWGLQEQDTVLTRVAAFCSSAAFTDVMDDFVVRNCQSWEESGDPLGTGEGASHDKLAAWRRVHQEYLELFEGQVEDFVRREGSDLSEFMDLCRDALQQQVQIV